MRRLGMVMMGSGRKDFLMVFDRWRDLLTAGHEWSERMAFALGLGIFVLPLVLGFFFLDWLTAPADHACYKCCGSASLAFREFDVGIVVNRICIFVSTLHFLMIY
jgi:hypothetical protein